MDYKLLQLPAVNKLSSGDFEVYDGLKCHSTDKWGALNLVSRLMIKGCKFTYYYEYKQVPVENFWRSVQ